MNPLRMRAHHVYRALMAVQDAKIQLSIILGAMEEARFPELVAAAEEMLDDAELLLYRIEGVFKSLPAMPPSGSAEGDDLAGGVPNRRTLPREQR